MSDAREANRRTRLNRPAGTALPWQNALLAGGGIAAVAATATYLNAWVGFPFGRCQVGPHGGLWFLHPTPAWLVPMSVVALLCARGVAKLLLRPRRKSGHYGYWLLALNTLLGTLPMAGLDLLATNVMHWWRWENAAWQWEGLALTNLAGWLVVGLLALLLATPALIDKRPVQSPPGLLPLAVWLGLNTLCVVGCVSRVSDAAVAVLAAPVLVVTMLAFQQHRRAVAHCGGPAGQE